MSKGINFIKTISLSTTAIFMPIIKAAVKELLFMLFEV
jgi:hypothetical protein